MAKAVVATGLLALLFGPATSLVALGVLLNPAAQASCLQTNSVSVGAVPQRLTAKTTDGTTVTLDRSQLTHAATIATVGRQIRGVDARGVKVALMAALTESSLRMLSNTSAHPESARYPNDGDGSDHDSLGLFQMRPSTGWGTVAQLMDPDYQARAFYGGPAGPNHGSPPGLLDTPGWRQLSPGAAAQAVEVSAHPDRYATFAPVVDAILRALTTAPNRSSGRLPVAEATRVVYPLPRGTWQKTDTFGPRTDPVAGGHDRHTGVDYAAPAGTPILAVADGRVAFAGPVSSGYAHLILIRHTIGGRVFVSGYAHMYVDGLHVREGEPVRAGQRIADIGAAGKATGPHLHFEIRPGGPRGTPIDPEPWLTTHAASEQRSGSAERRTGCIPSAPGDATPFPGTKPGRMVDDPTSTGRITARTAYVLAQLRQRSPGSSWACWRPGDTRSEHPDGRACDGTFGNPIGQPAQGPALALGWQITNWLKTNARTLGVEYLIWQGRIWSVARSAEGWRPYDGGGLHSPISVTGSHADHLHITIAS